MTLKFLSGSEAAAWGAKLTRVEVISAYPISPNTAVLAALSDMASAGLMDAEIVNVEGEHSAGSVCAGATTAGARSLTATCGQGMAYMHEVLWMASGMALPFVIVATSRAIGAPESLVCDFSDTLSERDASILQFYPEDAQEVVDSVIMAYRVGEHPDVLLPSFVCVEGYRLTHASEPVEVPEQEAVDAFLPPYRPPHMHYDVNDPLGIGHTALQEYWPMKYQQHQAMLRAKDVTREVCEEFARQFGRRYDLVEPYRTDDAEVVLVAIGTSAAVARQVADAYRTRGVKVGVLKLRVFRPFPEEDIRAALAGARAVLVLDRFLSPGAHGVCFTEVKGALYGTGATVSSYMIGHRDIAESDVERMVEVALQRQEAFEEWYAFDIDVPKEAAIARGVNIPRLRRGDRRPNGQGRVADSYFAAGTTTCAGCSLLLALRQCLAAMGDNAVCVFTTGCMQATTAINPHTAWKIPTAHFLFDNSVSGACGVEMAFRRKGIGYNILVAGGDGAFADIGFQALSGAVERGHNLTFVCFDNEAYMNTGVQRSSTTSRYARTKTTPLGKAERRKNIARIMEDHGCYVATALPAFPNDLIRKVRKGRDIRGPAFIHVLCPCPTGWLFEEARSIELARLAFETGAWVLYEYQDGTRTVSRTPKERKPISAYLSPQGRFGKLTDAQIAEIQEEVDRQYRELTGL